MEKKGKVSNRILLRVYFLFGCFVLLGAGIILRIGYLQWNSEKWDIIDKEDRISVQKFSADRGNILAENGTILATSLPFYKMALDPMLIDTAKFVNFNDSLKVLSYSLYHLIGKTEAEKDSTLGIDSLFYYKRIREAMKKKDRHLFISKKLLNYREYTKAKDFPILNRKRKEGGALIVEKINNRRFYPYGEMAKVALGTLSDDTAGIRGIEFSYNRYLKGKDGYFLAYKIPGGHYVPVNDFSEAEIEDGYDVVTTIDVDFQDITEKALEKSVISNQAKAGTAILMEVATGKIKAIANYPETYNHGIAGLYEPGSTFKLASALAALEEHAIDVMDTVDTGEGVVKIGDKSIADDHPIGKATYQTVFAKSSNVGISMVAQKGFQKNPEKFIEYLEKFGLSTPANTQLKGEPTPTIIRTKDKEWSGATLASMSIGYSLRITPLQLLAFYNAVANGGKYVEPYMMTEIRDNSKQVLRLTPPKSERQICSYANIPKVKKLLEAVVEYGTAKNIHNTIFKIAGKTGTARKFENGQYVSRYRASFAGFFPSDNPVYSCIVMIDEPSAGDIYGAEVAAPVFREIATKVYTLDKQVLGKLVRMSPEPITKPAPKIMRSEAAKELYEELGIQTSDIPDSGWVATKGNDGHQINFREFKGSGKVPDVRGLSARDALNLLEELGVKVLVSGVGKVRSQSLAPGYKIGKGDLIKLYLN